MIGLKSFHCKIGNDHEALKNEADSYQPIPQIRKVDGAVIQRNYQQIRQQVQDIIERQMEKIMNDPTREGLIVKTWFSQILDLQKYFRKYSLY